MPTSSLPAAQGLEHQLLDVFLYMGSQWVLYLLLLLSVVSIAITFERLLHFVRRRIDADELQSKLDAMLTELRHQDLI